ncbi:adenosylmethionine decarboxylase [Ephemerocybe angulata]|uniref:adenosylmethionine decarboxylase n=1 Tax=Ephemerocybe angulata TaxID=980116 RepID=A0A8H6I6V8_9AGAR|nr:adenosylmethionine decarboxylase [Tulosesus angulatus]
MSSISESSAPPFEGPEKLLEIWFAPTAAHVPSEPSVDGRTGLRLVDRKAWEEMLDIVQCKVLSVVNGKEMDAYLLSESSLFVSPHKLILKTCGTTLNLLGLPRILEIAAGVNLPTVHRCFYSRKSFMFPERQSGPHRDWKEEVGFLDKYFDNGAAYTVGKMNGDHWLLYLTNPEDQLPSSPTPSQNGHSLSVHSDYTIEILMSGLSPAARNPFFNAELSEDPENPGLPLAHGQAVSQKLGISDIFPSHLTTLDAYSFVPCGYSSNALIKWGEESLDSDCPAAKTPHSGEGYYTIHVTPEEGWSYASFECNVPLSVSEPTAGGADDDGKIPTLKELIKRVVNIFQPSRLSLTLFISAEDTESAELAQRAFKSALEQSPANSDAEGAAVQKYKRTDKINYEFGGYDLAFASFELK